MADTQRLNDDDDNIQTSLGVQYEAQKRKKYIYGGVALLLTLILIIVIIVATTAGGSSSSGSSSVTWPVVVATWNRLNVANEAYQAMATSNTTFRALDGAVKGIQWCQSNCGGEGAVNVDTEGKVTQSAMVMWGPSMESGSVANLYYIDDAVDVARDVMIYTSHAILVGEAATRFAVQTGKTLTNFTDTDKETVYQEWLDGNCAKQYWRNVFNAEGCGLINGDYHKKPETDITKVTGCDANETSLTPPTEGDELQSGTVKGSAAIMTIDGDGNMAIATSSNGLDNKIAGRVSDAAIPGAGGYIDPEVGGCVATGDGDVIIRFAPAKTGVTFMKTGSTPQEAAQLAIDEMDPYCGKRQTFVLCMDKHGLPGIAHNRGTANPPKYAYKSLKCETAVAADAENPRGTCT